MEGYAAFTEGVETRIGRSYSVSGFGGTSREHDDAFITIVDTGEEIRDTTETIEEKAVSLPYLPPASSIPNANANDTNIPPSARPTGKTANAVDNTKDDSESQNNPIIPRASTPTTTPSSLPKTLLTQKRIDSPSVTPASLRTITPSKEKSVDDISEPDDKEVIAPPVISTRSSIRADGTRETITTREATPEELRDLQRTTTEALETVDTYRETTQFRGGIDAFVPSPGSPSQPGTFEETKRTPAMPSNTPELTPSGIPDDSSINDDPKPDADDNKPPFIPPPPVSTPPPECKGCNKKILDKMDGLTLGAQGLDLALVQQIHSTVHSSAHGLAKIQSFAETAWKVTKADKIMTGVSMALTVHNAMMLSNNLLATVSEATNMAFNALGIRDETDTEFDFGQAIKDKIDAVLSSVLGQANYDALTVRIAKANRIYQSSINLLDTTYSLFDSARTVAELTAENTGKIGNALRESGAVYEDAYEEFIEQVNPQNTSQRRLANFREGLESVEMSSIPSLKSPLA